MIVLAVPGTGPLHRAPAGVKVVALLAVTVAAYAVRALPLLGALVGVVALGYMLAAPPWRVLGRFLRFLVLTAAVLLGVQWWFLGLDAASVIVARFVVTIAAAHLLTLTTPVDALVSMVERLGLLVGLTVSAVAALTRIAADVTEAARARGAERSVTARTVPFVIRALRHADELGEALAARGVGDE